MQSQFNVCTFGTAYNLMCHLHRFCWWKATKDLWPKCAAHTPQSEKQVLLVQIYFVFVYSLTQNSHCFIWILNDNISNAKLLGIIIFFCTIPRFFMRPIFHFHPGVNVGSEFSSGCIQRLQLKHLKVRTIFSPQCLQSGFYWIWNCICSTASYWGAKISR